MQAILCASLLVSQAGAQVFETRDDGIHVGRFIIYPSIGFDLERDSNVFYRTDDLGDDEIVDSDVIVVSPEIMVDLPFRENRIRWAYSPVYRDYTNEEVQENDEISHFFDLEADFQLGRSLSLTFRDHFVQDTEQLEEVDPGGELTFGLGRFEVHEPKLDLTLDLGARHGISLLPSYSTVDFDEAAAAVFFSYESRGLETRYNYRVSEMTTLYGYYNLEDTDQERDQPFRGEVSIKERSFGIGLRREVNQVVNTLLAAGYKTMDFEGGADSNFVGLTLEARMTLRVSELTRLDLSAVRRPHQSFFANNNYYVSTEGSIRLTQQLARSMYWRGRLSFGENGYSDPLAPGQIFFKPSEGKHRRDHTLGVDLELGFRVHPRATAVIGYNYQVRRSNIEALADDGTTIDPFDYDVNHVRLGIEVGWK